MARSPSPTAKPAGPDVTIKTLLSYRIHRVANMMSRSAGARYRVGFDVSLAEWRTIALLGAEAPLSLNELAREAGLDKGQISRVISGLADRGLVLRELANEGGRTVRLTLTRPGQALYRSLISAATERNNAFLACLSAEERLHLDSALEKLATLARALRQATITGPGQSKTKGPRVP
jgi:DNA-binding MarR family transcriptional regulator